MINALWITSQSHRRMVCIGAFLGIHIRLAYIRSHALTQISIIPQALSLAGRGRRAVTRIPSRLQRTPETTYTSMEDTASSPQNLLIQPHSVQPLLASLSFLLLLEFG